MSWRAKSSYFSHASSYRENVASARRVPRDEIGSLQIKLTVPGRESKSPGEEVFSSQQPLLSAVVSKVPIQIKLTGIEEHKQ